MNHCLCDVWCYSCLCHCEIWMNLHFSILTGSNVVCFMMEILYFINKRPSSAMCLFEWNCFQQTRVNVSAPSWGVGLCFCFCFSVHTQYLFFTDPQIWNQVVVHIQTIFLRKNFFLQVLFFKKKLKVSFQFDPAKIKWSVLPSTHIKVQQQAAHLLSLQHWKLNVYTSHTSHRIRSALLFTRKSLSHTEHHKNIQTSSQVLFHYNHIHSLATLLGTPS